MQDHPSSTAAKDTGVAVAPDILADAALGKGPPRIDTEASDPDGLLQSNERAQATSRRMWGLAVSLLGLATIASIWFAVRRAAPDAVSVPEEVLDLGKVWENPAFVLTLPIKNNTGRKMDISGFQTSCNCVAIDPRSLTLLPDDVARVRLTLDLTRALLYSDARRVNEDMAKAEEGELRVHVLPDFESVDKRSPPQHPWTIRGRVRRALSLNPSFISFGDSLVQGQPATPRTAEITAHAEVRSLRAKCEPPLATVDVKPSASARSKYELTIQPRDGLPSGELKCAVLLHPEAEDGISIPVVVLPIEGRIMGDVQATPSVVVLGACVVGQSVRETIILRSIGNNPFHVKAIAPSSSSLSVEEGQTMDNMKEFHIVQRIVKDGQHSTNVRFVVQHGSEQGTTALLVQVSYLGIVN